MGYNQNHAGIHPVPRGYRGARDTVQPYDKYAAMIVESKERNNKSEIPEKLFKEVELCNFVMLEKKRGEIKKCLCGGRLNYKSNLIIKYRHNGVMKSVEMDGKQCVDCGRKLFVRSELMERFRKA